MLTFDNKHYIKILGLLLLLTLLSFFTANSQAQEQTQPFDHKTTGFMLIGAHSRVDCGNCHRSGIFKGTPRQCSGCHGRGGIINAAGKNLRHILSTDTCSDCHNTSAWWPATTVNHSSVFGTCLNCHNNATAMGKPTNHLASSNFCEDCHNNHRWTPARYNHRDASGSCSSCHNNTNRPGKPNSHIVTTFECDSCHTIRGWSPAQFNHSNVESSCSSCHNGTQATGKTGTHITTTLECNSCHSTRAWTPASFDHSGITSGCANCHNGTTATGKPGGHIVTTSDCNACHSTNGWSNASFTHTSPNYPGNHGVSLTCSDCHGASTPSISWPSPTYANSCAGCHANDFDPGEHNQSLSTLRDCGRCHSVSRRGW